jgi:hypothetical protein
MIDSPSAIRDPGVKKPRRTAIPDDYPSTIEDPGTSVKDPGKKEPRIKDPSKREPERQTN